ncbi:MAG: UDP-N-acetylglucosamine-peptide N-acetylglucosaminyltransferase [Burkholderiales bacterium]
MSESRRAAARFHEILTREPGNEDARHRLAAALFAYGHELRASGAIESAAVSFAQAAKFAPEDADAWIALGNACMEAEMRRIEAARGSAAAQGEDWLAHAVDAFARAVALRPGAADVAARHAMAARYACAWRDAAPSLAVLHAAQDAACEPMSAVALIDDAQRQRAAIAGWSRGAFSGAVAPAYVKQRGTRLRVGYLSTDFHDHATAHLAAGLFECHDKARVETFAYAADRDDGSPMRARLRAAFDHWRDVREMPDAQAAEIVRRDDLDVLVDLKGHTRGTRLGILRHRPAPVQLHYLGFPGTLATEGVDGTIVDGIVAPSDEEFAERALRLPVCYQVNDHKRTLPPAARREELGLPSRGLVLACFNQTYKLTEPFARAWLDALREHDDAVLWLNVPHPLARRNLAAFAEACSVDPARIVFAPMVSQAAHLARLQCADLALDVLPYGSHTTGSDALFAGVPLLTCRGTTFAGRVGASLLHAVELPELVCASMEDYATRLRALCADRAHIAHWRDHLIRGRASLPLFDTPAFTRHFERLLEAAV